MCHGAASTHGSAATACKWVLRSGARCSAPGPGLAWPWPGLAWRADPAALSSHACMHAWEPCRPLPLPAASLARMRMCEAVWACHATLWRGTRPAWRLGVSLPCCSAAGRAWLRPTRPDCLRRLRWCSTSGAPALSTAPAGMVYGGRLAGPGGGAATAPAPAPAPTCCSCACRAGRWMPRRESCAAPRCAGAETGGWQAGQGRARGTCAPHHTIPHHTSMMKAPCRQAATS